MLLEDVGGQAVKRRSHETFDTANELVQVYQRFLDDASVRWPGVMQVATSGNHGSMIQALNKWLDEMPATLTGLTGPKAPHLFRIVQKTLTVLSLNLRQAILTTFCCCAIRMSPPQSPFKQRWPSEQSPCQGFFQGSQGSLLESIPDDMWLGRFATK